MAFELRPHCDSPSESDESDPSVTPFEFGAVLPASDSDSDSSCESNKPDASATPFGFGALKPADDSDSESSCESDPRGLLPPGVFANRPDVFANRPDVFANRPGAFAHRPRDGGLSPTSQPPANKRGRPAGMYKFIDLIYLGIGSGGGPKVDAWRSRCLPGTIVADIGLGCKCRSRCANLARLNPNSNFQLDCETLRGELAKRTDTGRREWLRSYLLANCSRGSEVTSLMSHTSLLTYL